MEREVMIASVIVLCAITIVVLTIGSAWR